MVTLPTQSVTVQVRIEPVFIEDLYAVVHYPQGVPKQGRAVLIAYPIAFEYERTHKAVRQLAIQLARHGYLVLRVDYRGTGDSSGDFTQWSMAKAQQDLLTARAYLQQMHHVKQLVVVGVRLGANVALQAFAGSPDVQGMVLWSPITDGQQMLQEWWQHQRDFEKPLGYVQSAPSAAAMQEVMGYRLTADFIRELDAYRLTQLPVQVPILGFSSQPPVLKTPLATWQVMENIEIWWQVSDAAVVPASLINQTVDWVEGL
jgi:pimeloyl-ACP methyl ester carboxylesterase